MPALKHWLYRQALQTFRVFDVIVQPPRREHWYFKQSRSFTLRLKKPCINANIYTSQRGKYWGNIKPMPRVKTFSLHRLSEIRSRSGNHDKLTSGGLYQCYLNHHMTNGHVTFICVCYFSHCWLILPLNMHPAKKNRANISFLVHAL